MCRSKHAFGEGREYVSEPVDQVIGVMLFRLRGRRASNFFNPLFSRIQPPDFQGLNLFNS